MYIHNQPIDIRDGSKIGIIAGFYEQIMKTLGIDLNDPHAKDTPMRVAKMMVNETMNGLEKRDFELTTFPAKDNAGEIVVVRNIEFYSLCAHHHVPFFGTADFAYKIKDKIVGLSKIPRLIKWCASKPTTQEDLCRDILEEFSAFVDYHAVGVCLKAKHLCMSMRGIENQGAETVTERFLWSGNLSRDEIKDALRGVR